MRGRLSQFILPYIVLLILILTTSLTYSRPQNNNNNKQLLLKEFDWTSVERVSRSLTDEEIMKQENSKNLNNNGKTKIGLVSNENDENDETNNIRNNNELVPIETDLSPDIIKQRGKATFDLLRPANDLPEAIIDPPLKTHQMRLDEWERKHQNKKGNRQSPPDWFNNRKNDSDVHGCVASPFSQRIHFAGCESKHILNRYCHGACASIYIPELRSKKLKAIFSNCLVCRPAEVEHIQVRLECPEGPVVRDVMRVKRCECQEIDAPLPT